MTKKKPRIVCLEGLYDEKNTPEPTIKPMLEMFKQWGYWDYCWQQTGQTVEAKEFLAEAWSQSEYGSVLYIASHGSAGSIDLSTGQSISLSDLCVDPILWQQCVGCYVHFSACNIIDNADAVNHFREETGAAAVSGYRTDVGWLDMRKPAFALDLMLMNHLSEAKLDFSEPDSYTSKLQAIEEELQLRFGDCQFSIFF